MENNQEYRGKITEICVGMGFEVIDPWNREKVLYKGNERCWWDKVPTFDFIQRDLDDADRCDIMVVYLPSCRQEHAWSCFTPSVKARKS